MVKHLVKHGNSLSLVIDKPLLQLMGLDENTPVKLELEGRRLIVTPAGGEDRRKDFRQRLESINRKHGKTLRKLAE
jgi:antitoxin component of MazEF toxin-antitoxin module